MEQNQFLDAPQEPLAIKRPLYSATAMTVMGVLFSPLISAVMIYQNFSRMGKKNKGIGAALYFVGLFGVLLVLSVFQIPGQYFIFMTIVGVQQILTSTWGDYYVEAADYPKRSVSGILGLAIGITIIVLAYLFAPFLHGAKWI
jgi:hypothetical protein